MTSRTCGGVTATFHWSAESRLDSASVGGVRWGYRYDAAGRLVRRDSAGVVLRHYVWEGDNLLAELTAAGTGIEGEYSSLGLDRLHALVRDTTVYYGHRDARGNALALTDGSQAWQRYWYTAWGTTTYAGTGAPFSGTDRARWKGALSFEGDAGLYYMRNRWYEPRTGRFLTEDPIGLDGGINVYTFASNDPVNGSDPTGLCDLWAITFWDLNGNGRFDQGDLEVSRICVGGAESERPGSAAAGPGSGTIPLGRITSAPRQRAPSGPSCAARFAYFAASGTLDVATWGVAGVAARLSTKASVLGTRAIVYSEIGRYASQGQATFGHARIVRGQAATAQTAAGSAGAMNYVFGFAASGLQGSFGDTLWEAAKIFVPFVATGAALTDWAANCL